MTTKLEQAAREVIRQHSMECLSDKSVDALREALAERSNHESELMMNDGNYRRKILAEQAEQVTEGNGSEVSLETEAQEPVGEVKILRMNTDDSKFHYVECQHLPEGTKLYAAPVRTKDLTDDEISKIWDDSSYGDSGINFARAVIAADREKNK